MLTNIKLKVIKKNNLVNIKLIQIMFVYVYIIQNK